MVPLEIKLEQLVARDLQALSPYMPLQQTGQATVLDLKRSMASC